jgi:hypothetical protein
MLVSQLFGLVGCVDVPATVADTGAETGTESGAPVAPTPDVAFRDLGSGEIYGGWNPTPEPGSFCEDVVAVVLGDEAALAGWVSENLQGLSLTGQPDWSSEIVVAATLDCRNGMHPLRLDRLVSPDVGSLEASYVLESGCIDTSAEAREYVVVAIPAVESPDLSANWTIEQETDC